MKKTATFVVACIICLNSLNAQCKKVDIAKLSELRTLVDSEYKKALDSLGFKEKRSSFGAKIFNRTCAENNVAVDESITKSNSTILYISNDRALFVLLQKTISNNSDYVLVETENKNRTIYKSKKENIAFEEKGTTFQISINSPL